MAGEPSPFEVYEPPSTVTSPPPRSVLIGALDCPLVVMVRLRAIVLPPPVVMMPPLLPPVVMIVMFET